MRSSGLNTLDIGTADTSAPLADRIAADLESASDERLMALVRGELREAAFEELVRRHSDAAYRTALACLRRRDSAEDAVQEAFLRIIRARRLYRPGMRFAPWFYTMLRNTCRDQLRRRAVRAEAPAAKTANSETTDPCSELVIREDCRAACRALGQLEELDRQILALRIHGDLEFAEISTIVNLSAEATKKRAYRALQRLREKLGGTA